MTRPLAYKLATLTYSRQPTAIYLPSSLDYKTIKLASYNNMNNSNMNNSNMNNMNSMFTSKLIEAYAELHLGAGGNSLLLSTCNRDEAIAKLTSPSLNRVMMSQGNVPLGIMETPGLYFSSSCQFIGVTKMEILCRLEISNSGAIKPLITPIYTRHDNCRPDRGTWQGYPQTTPFYRKGKQGHMVYVAPAFSFTGLQSTSGKIHYSYYNGNEKLNEFKVIIGEKTKNVNDAKKAFLNKDALRDYVINHLNDGDRKGYYVVTIFGLVGKYEISKNNKMANSTQKKHDSVNPKTGKGFEHRMNIPIASAFIQEYTPGFNPLTESGFNSVEDLSNLYRKQNMPKSRETLSEESLLLNLNLPSSLDSTGDTPGSTDSTESTGDTPGSTDSTESTGDTPGSTDSTESTEDTPGSTDSTESTEDTPESTDSTESTGDTPESTESQLEKIVPPSSDTSVVRTSNFEKSLDGLDSGLYSIAEELDELGKVTLLAYLWINYRFILPSVEGQEELIKDMANTVISGEALDEESLLSLLALINNFGTFVPKDEKKNLGQALKGLLKSRENAIYFLQEVLGTSDSFSDEDNSFADADEDDSFADADEDDSFSDEDDKTSTPDPSSSSPDPFNTIQESETQTGSIEEASSYEEVSDFFEEKTEAAAPEPFSPSPFSITEEETDAPLPGTGNGDWAHKKKTSKTSTDKFLDTQDLSNEDPSGLT